MKSVALLLTLSLVWVVAGSCNTSGCTDNQSAIPLAGFYSSATGEQVSLDSLEIRGLGAPGDSMLLTPGTPASMVYLPLRIDQADTRYVIAYRMGEATSELLNDTLYFAYTSTPYFVSEECGASFRYRIKAFEYTRHMIDSIALLDTEITNIDLERLKIFFHVVDDEPAEE